MNSDTHNQLALNDAPLVAMEDFRQWILHEDENLLVLDKPGWLVCHPSKNGPFSSLVGTAKEYLKSETLHLVSRLDRETSGVVLLAKNRKAASYWQKGVEMKSVRRCYLAILEGVMSEPQEVSTFLGKDPESAVFVKQRVTENSRKAKYAETHFLPLVSQSGFTLCSITTVTGRKHQIRVHAQSIGCPLVGEKLYGKDEGIYLEFCAGGWRDEWSQLLGMYRQALHGRCLTDSNSKWEFLSPLPDDFVEFLRGSMNLQSDAINQLVREADIQFQHNLSKN